MTPPRWATWTAAWRRARRTPCSFNVIGVVATVIATIWMYAFGTGDPAEMKYFLGMPMWISGAIVIYLVMFAAGMIWLVKWEEFPLTARFKKNKESEKEGGNKT